MYYRFIFQEYLLGVTYMILFYFYIVACAKTSKADIVIATTGVRNPRDLNEVTRMTKKITSSMETDSEHVRIGVVPNDCSSSPEMQLKDSFNKENVIRNLNKMAAAERGAASTINFMRTSSFSVTSGARENPNVRRIGILVVGDNVKNMGDTLKEARKAMHLNKVELFVVGVGDHVHSTGLKLMSSRPFSNHIFRAADYTQLPSIADKLLEQLCN